MFEEQALRLDQKPIEELLAAAKAFHRRNQYPKACRWLREVVARQPGRGEVHYWLGAALIPRRRYREAISSLLEAARCGFDRPDLHLRLGEAYLAQSERKLDPEAERHVRRKEAVGAFTRAIDMAGTTLFIDGSLAEAQLGAARAEAALGQTDAALARLEAALRAAPDEPAVYVPAQRELRKLLAGRGDLDARFGWLRGIVHRARRPEPYLELAGTFAELGRQDAAIREYLWAAWRYAKLRGAGQAQDLGLPSIDWQPAPSDVPAAATCERLLRRRPPPLVEAALGFALFAGREVGSGITALARALERSPADPGIYRLANAAIQRGQDLEAKQKLLDALGAVVRCAGNPEAWTEWGHLLVALRRSDDAGEAFRRGNAEGYVAWARLLVERERNPEEALTKLTHAVDLAEQTGRLGAWLESSVRVINEGGSDTRLEPSANAVGSIILEIGLFRDCRLAALVDRVERNLLPTTRQSALSIWAQVLASLGRPVDSLARVKQALAAASEPEDKLWMPWVDDTLIQLDPWRGMFARLDRAWDNEPRLRDALMTAVTESGNQDAHEALAIELTNKGFLTRARQKTLIEDKYWAEAERVCLSWSRLTPEDARPYERTGRIYFEQQRFDMAVAADERALERVPDRFVYERYLAALREIEIEGGAIGALRVVARAWNEGLGDQRPDWFAIGCKHDQILRKVLRVVEEFEQHVDDASGVLDFAGQLTWYGLHDQAARLFEKYHDLDPGSFQGYRAWGAALSHTGDPIAALRPLRRVIKANAAWFWPHVDRANCHIVLGRLKWASRAFERALTNGTEFYGGNPNEARISALTTWAIALSNAGLGEEALARADQAHRIDENDYWALFCKGYVFAHMGAYEQAKGYYERACGAKPSIPNAHHNLVSVLESQGFYRAARSQLNQALDVYARGLEAQIKDRDTYLFRFHAALCRKAHDEKRAEDLLRMALLLDPGNPDHEQALAIFYFGQDKVDTVVRLTGDEEDALPVRTPARLNAIEHYRRAETGLKRRLSFARTADTHLSLADL